MSYSTFIHGVVKAGIPLDRRTLAELAISEPISFRAVVDTVKESPAPPRYDTDPVKAYTVAEYKRFAAAGELTIGDDDSGSILNAGRVVVDDDT